MNIASDVLKKLWPHAPQALVNAVAEQSQAVFDKYKINTPLRVLHFMAQVSHESGGGTVTAESLTYTHAARIAAVWPSRFTADSARPYVNNARLLADKVYNGRMGNEPGTDDGYNYRGRGLLQITGRESYRTIGSLCGLPLEAQPDLAFAPSHALDVAAAEFVHLGCLPFCDKDDIRTVTKRVNGGLIGLDSRKAWLTRWKLAIPDFPGELPESIADLHEIAPVDDTPVPRGGDNDDPKPMTHSTIGNGAVATGGLGVAATASQLWETASQALDKVTSLPDSVMQALLELAHKPAFWCSLAVVAGAGYVWWKRYRLKQDAGV